MPVNWDCSVVSVGEWQSEHPMGLNRAEAFCVEDVEVPRAGGADNRLNSAKFTTSDDISEAVPIGLPKFALLGLPFSSGVKSSGVLLKTQPGTALRSFG